MTRLEVLQALHAGASAVREGPAADVIALGEVGIGNTTAAAALLALLTGADETEVVGNGTGIGPQTKARKAAAVTRAVRRAQPALSDVLELVAESGGLEIAALAGAILGAASRHIPVLLDGFIVGAAALIAYSLAPATSDYTIASHRSAERGHAIVLDRLLLEPLLQLDLRLGEASGAALALPLVDAACAVLRDVRTFQEAGIEPPIDERGAV
jgi:nicotinate-nucleotide--dimethylbenzimidazole phosphoribosyltransferase